MSLKCYVRLKSCLTTNIILKITQYVFLFQPHRKRQTKWTLKARKMTTVYFIKLSLVLCVAFNSNKNLQKNIPYIQKIILFLSITLFYFTSKMFFFPRILALQTLSTMHFTEKDYFYVLNIWIFLEYTTYTTFTFFTL